MYVCVSACVCVVYTYMIQCFKIRYCYRLYLFGSFQKKKKIIIIIRWLREQIVRRSRHSVTLSRSPSLPLKVSWFIYKRYSDTCTDIEIYKW